MTVLEITNRHNDMMKYMESFQSEMSPYVGIFWYDSDNNELFGVDKVESDLLPFSSSGLKTTPRLHKHFWAKQYNKAKQLGIDSKFNQPDYTLVPRGRVFQCADGSFEVMVGSWVNDYPKCKSLILSEFDLPADTKFLEDSHWNVGSGWEGDK